MMKVWHEIILAIKEPLIVITTILSFLIPFTVNLINKKLHEYGDPPWKKEEKNTPFSHSDDM